MTVKRLRNVYSVAIIQGLLAALCTANTGNAGGLGELIQCGDDKLLVVARVPIIDLQGNRPDEVTVALASADQLALAGMTHSADVLGLVVGTDWADPSDPAVQISGCVQMSDEPLNLLLDMRWPSGRLLRQYAVRPKASPVESITRIQDDKAPNSAGDRVLTPPSAAQYAYDLAAALSTSNVSANADLPSGSIYLVIPGDTIWSIASRLTSSKTVNDRIDDIMAANPSAFLNNNINLLRADAILRMP
jgi:pilus assembly protein FimV